MVTAETRPRARPPCRREPLVAPAVAAHRAPSSAAWAAAAAPARDPVAAAALAEKMACPPTSARSPPARLRAITLNASARSKPRMLRLRQDEMAREPNCRLTGCALIARAISARIGPCIAPRCICKRTARALRSPRAGTLPHRSAAKICEKASRRLLFGEFACTRSRAVTLDNARARARPRARCPFASRSCGAMGGPS